MNLIDNEVIKSEVNIGNERFTVTDKRLLYTNGTNNAFIGLNELRGAQITEQDFRFYGFNLPSSEALLPLVVIGSLFASWVYICSTSKTYTFSDISPIFFAMGLCIPVVPVVLIVLNIIKALTGSTEKKVVLQISKTDNNFFANQYYDLEHTDKLNELDGQINMAIYK